MKIRHLLTLALALLTVCVFAQVSINTAGPKALFQKFLEAEQSGRISDAAEFIDLPTVTLEQKEKAVKKLAALIHLTDPDLNVIPDRLEEARYVADQITDKSGKVVGEIEAIRREDGNWVFSRAFYEDLEVMSQQLPVRKTEAPVALLQPPADSLNPLEAKFIGVTLFQWIALAAVLLVSYAIGILARIALRKWVFPWIVGHAHALPEKELRKFARSLSYLAAILIFQAIARRLNLEPEHSEAFKTTYVIIRSIIVIGFLWSAWSIFCLLTAGRAEKKYRRANTLFLPILQKMGQLIIAVGVILYVAGQMGFNVTGIVTGLGIGGAILALAAKDTVENFFGSLTVLFEAPFEIGDWVKIGDIEGTVEDISLRSTRIRTFSDSLVTQPNSKLITAAVENFGRRRARQFKTRISLTAGTNPEEALSFVTRGREFLEAREDLLPEKRYLFIFDFGDTGCQVQLNCYILAATLDDELKSRESLVEGLMQIAEETGVSLAGLGDLLALRNAAKPK